MKTQKLFSLLAASLFFAFAANAATPPLNPPLFGWQVWPASGERIVPTSAPPEDATNAVVRMVSAKGVVASASFAVRSMAAFPSLAVEVSDLKTSDGATLPAKQIDLRVVKCWYQDRNGWFTDRRGPGASVLVPELLLHDDSLVKTDSKTRENLVRTSAAGEPAAYRRIKAAKGGAVTPAADFVAADDAEKLLPVSIAKKEARQFYLTIDVPADAKPGVYNGVVSFKAADRELGHFDLRLSIIDHLLPAATSRFFGGRSLDGAEVATGKSPAVLTTAEEPCHFVGALPPSLHSPSRLSILTSIGMTDPVIIPSDLAKLSECFGTTLPKSLWIAAPGALDMEPKGAPSPDAIKKIAEVARKTGVKDIRVYIPSRLSGEGLQKDLPTLTAADDAGIRAWAFADDDTYGVASDVLTSPMRRGYPRAASGIGDRIHGNTVPPRGNPYGHIEHSDSRQCERWGALGIPYYLYSTLPAGVEDPSVWRRRLGAEAYLLGYSGIVLSSLVEPVDPWNDWASADHRSRTFIYPTKTGFVSTLAWEGVRDAIIDCRYLSSVNRLANDVRFAGRDFARLDLEGRKAAHWLDFLRSPTCGLDTMRLDAIAWIDHLQLILDRYAR